ncbi:MAG: thrombospondin type 3 repeat-containing protein [Myxococcales bacterium]|nr:thrombospondin type 3 repeat-containing protein [Myxococcales bacterium]
MRRPPLSMLVVSALVGAGCNQVLGIDQVHLVDALGGDDGAVGDGAGPDGTDGDAAINDRDGDTVPDDIDNCPDVANRLQRDTDGDRLGDLCDSCPNVAVTTPANVDGDGLDDACDLDLTARQCIAWFDPFRGTSAAHYTVPSNGHDNGAWVFADDGLRQDAAATSDALLVTTATFAAPRVRVAATVLTTMPPANDAGVNPDFYNVGLWLHVTPTSHPLPDGCLVEVTDPVSAAPASLSLVRTVNGAATSTSGPVPIGAALVSGALVAITGGATTTALSGFGEIVPVSVATATSTACTGLGTRVGLRTRFTRVRFDSLLITDVNPTACPPAPAPCACPPPPEL